MGSMLEQIYMVSVTRLCIWITDIVNFLVSNHYEDTVQVTIVTGEGNSTHEVLSRALLTLEHLS